MNKFYFRTLLWITGATSFLLSCSKVEKDQIKPTSTKTTNATARIDGVLYDQLQPETSDFIAFGFGAVLAEDFVVPVGETWNLEKMVFYRWVPVPSPDLIFRNITVRIYSNDGGKPGELLSTFINPPLELLNTFQPEGYTVHVMGVDIEDTELKEGTYFVGFAAPGGGFGSFYQAPGVGLPSFYVYPDGGLSDPKDFSGNFQLLGSVVTETTIEDVLTTFNNNITAGTITGTGPGKSAANRVNAFKNMLTNAQALLAANDLAGACTQLTDAQKRIHTGGKIRPDHFITGSKAGALKDLIAELKTDLGCL